MIRRGKYIIFGVKARVEMKSVAVLGAECPCLKVAEAARLLLVRMGVGRAPGAAEVLTDPQS